MPLTLIPSAFKTYRASPFNDRMADKKTSSVKGPKLSPFSIGVYIYGGHGVIPCNRTPSKATHA